ncbi:universal stress protein [Promicromonospora sukumoe]|uniref:universal stress protein n=1 Tax=Promicromonospora sukumoe TaxID=88382 RepID=UPI00364B6980
MRTAQQPAPVLVAVDGSGRSAGAVRYAVREARLRGTSLRIVHVAPTTLPEGGLWPSVGREVEDLRSSGELVLDRAVSRTSAAAPDVEVDSLLCRGPRVGELARASAAGALLVLGRETRHGLERLVAGATTAGVVARAPVPVVVVRADWGEDVDRPEGADRPENPGPDAVDTGGLVVGVRSYPGDGELLAHAYAAAAVRQATLRLVQVADVADLAPDAAEGADVDAAVDAGRRMLREAVGDWSDAFPEVPVQSTVVPGRPADALVEAAADAELLLVARPHRDLRHPARLGRTLRTVVRTSGTPVEVVPLSGDPAPAPSPPGTRAIS